LTLHSLHRAHTQRRQTCTCTSSPASSVILQSDCGAHASNGLNEMQLSVTLPPLSLVSGLANTAPLPPCLIITLFVSTLTGPRVIRLNFRGGVQPWCKGIWMPTTPCVECVGFVIKRARKYHGGHGEAGVVVESDRPPSIDVGELNLYHLIRRLVPARDLPQRGVGKKAPLRGRRCRLVRARIALKSQKWTSAYSAGLSHAQILPTTT
jgi:hypothetical protein